RLVDALRGRWLRRRHRRLRLGLRGRLRQARQLAQDSGSNFFSRPGIELWIVEERRLRVIHDPVREKIRPCQIGSLPASGSHASTAAPAAAATAEAAATPAATAETATTRAATAEAATTEAA